MVSEKLSSATLKTDSDLIFVALILQVAFCVYTFFLQNLFLRFRITFF